MTNKTAGVEIDDGPEYAVRPERVLVNGTPWTIKFVDEFTMRLQEGMTVEDDAVVGCTYPQRLTIFIGDWTPSYVQRRTVVHELLHACWEDMPNISFGRKGIGHGEVEEVVISGIDQAVFSVILNNPGLIYWLTEPDDGDA